MNLCDSNDDLVSRVSLYKARHPLLYGYTSPFLLLYLTWLYCWGTMWGFNDYWEAGIVVGVILGLVNVLVLLCCHWSVHIMAAMTCTRVRDSNSATLAKVRWGTFL